MAINIIHGIYMDCSRHRNTLKIISNLPKKFKVLIRKKWKKFKDNLIEKERLLEFTFGYDDASGVSAIGIVHPLNQFSKKIGERIVTGRIQRMKGEIKHIIYEHDDEIIDGIMIMKLKRDEQKNPIIKEIQYRVKYDPFKTVYINVK